MNITITGNLGSGKSSAGKILKEHGYEIVSTGNIFRQLAMDKGLSVEEFNKQVNEAAAKGDRSVDKLIDDTTTKIGKEKDHIIFDSRLAWNFVPDSFKVFVITDIDEAARRVFNDSQRADSESYDSQDDCKKALIHRQKMETVRYQDIYHIDYYDMSNYNLVIESTNASPTDVAEEILNQLSLYEKGQFKKTMLLNPASIYPVADSLNDGEVVVNEVNGVWLIKSGLALLRNAMENNIRFIPVKIDSGFKPQILSKDEYQKFEAENHIQYKKYPDNDCSRNSSFMNFSKM